MSEYIASVADTVKEFSDLIVSGLENPTAVTGVVTIEIVDSEQSSYITVTLSKADITVENNYNINCDASVRLPIKTIRIILATLTEVDFRDPEIMSTITMTGKLQLVNHVVKALLRPTLEVQKSFKYAESTSAASYSLSKLPRITKLSEWELLNYIQSSQPIIITDLDLPRSHNYWTLSQLENSFSDVPLRVRSADQSETVGEFIKRLRLTDSTNSDVIEGHTKVYTEGCTLPQDMVNYFLPAFLEQQHFIEPQIWLGSMPVNVPASSLHRDALCGFLYQITGRKKVLLYSPDQADLLYPYKAYNNYQPCWVKPECPDYNTFPKFKRARAIEVTLNPGELLIQPRGWFHSVYCLDSPTFSVSYFLRH